MAENQNGKSSITTNLPMWENKEEVTKNVGDQLCTKQEVQQYVSNAFKMWHAPDRELLHSMTRAFDCFLLYLAENGIEVKDGRVTMTMEQLHDWAEAHKAAANTPKEQQS